MRRNQLIKTKHMPEPWRLEMGIITASDGTLFMQQMAENTQRILACVNAMEGIQDPLKLRKDLEFLNDLKGEEFGNIFFVFVCNRVIVVSASFGIIKVFLFLIFQI